MPILQVNFKLNVSIAEYESICDSFAPHLTNIPGMRWKIWLLNEQEGEAGGLYLFDTQESLDAYLAGPVIAQVKALPAIRDITAKVFDVMEDVTAITKGPVAAMAATH